MQFTRFHIQSDTFQFTIQETFIGRQYIQIACESYFKFLSI